jgi:protease IV
MFKKLLQYIFFSVLSIVLIALFFVVIAAFTMGPKVKRESILVLNLTGPLMEEGLQDWKQKLLTGDVLTVRDIILALQKGARDNRIKGLVVTSLGADLGFAKAQDVRAAIKEFAAKKPTYGFIEDGDTLEYYVCSAAPKLYMAPAGEGGISFVGLRAEAPFFKGTLDKLGIVPQMDHIGAYKSASDTFMRDSMSDAQREATSALLDSIYDRMTGDIAKDRGITIEQVKQSVDAGPLVRTEVQSSHLVTGLKYKDELDEMIKSDLKLKDLNEVSVMEYKEPTFRESFNNPKNKIAIIYASGAIASGDSSKGYEEDYMGSKTITGALKDAREDDSVKAVVLRVDSPGGSAVASDLIWREVIVTKKVKPVVVSMSDVAASGGYYISMGASKVLAQPSTITGSIGVVLGKFVLKGLYDKIGLNKEIIKRGKHADLFSDYVPFDDEEWGIIHKQMNAVYESFTTKAAEGRKKTQPEIDAVGQGRVWTGEQALKLGLVDQLGGFNDAINVARKLAKLPDTEDVGFSIYPARKGGFSDIVSLGQSRIQLPDEISTMLTYGRIAEHEHVLLWMPYRFKH